MTDTQKKDGTLARTTGSEGLGSNSEISRKLKQYYDDLVSHEVPDKFMDLLSQLDSDQQPTSHKAKG